MRLLSRVPERRSDSKIMLQSYGRILKVALKVRKTPTTKQCETPEAVRKKRILDLRRKSHGSLLLTEPIRRTVDKQVPERRQLIIGLGEHKIF